MAGLFIFSKMLFVNLYDNEAKDYIASACVLSTDQL
jgi:hypothetical protein